MKDPSSDRFTSELLASRLTEQYQVVILYTNIQRNVEEYLFQSMYFISFHQFGMIACRYCQTPKRDASVNTKTAPGSQIIGPGKSAITIANCVAVCDLFIKLCEVE